MTAVDEAAGPVVVVGRGRMGSLLLGAWRDAGVEALGLAGRDAGCGVPPPAATHGPTLWVLAVRDAALEETAARVAGWVRPVDVAIHLAGMRGPEALAPLRGRVAGFASAHPLVAVSSTQPGRSLAGGAVLSEGDPAAVARCRVSFGALGVSVWEAPAVDRAAYHGGAALVATGAVALAQGATSALRAALGGAATEPFLRAAVASLLRSVADNVLADGADRALASPLLRDDTTAVAAHLAALAAVDAPAAGLYRAALRRVLVALRAEGRVSDETLTRAAALADGAG
jgi:predicted short-subunit dehydrogenase-like oxidoreductase (DUF2520 family)